MSEIQEILLALAEGRPAEEAIPTDVYSYRWQECDLDRALFLLGNSRAGSLRVKYQPESEPVPSAYARRWFIDGEAPYKVRDERTKRMRLATKFTFKEATATRLFADDVPLYTRPLRREVKP